MVVENWNESTQEQLDPTDQRLTLLGDRGEQRRAVTEEAWRVVHACVQWTIHVTRCISHSGNATKRLQAPAMMREARKKLQELVAARWRRALIEKRTGEFRSNWVETGACLQAKGGSVKACALSRPGKKQPAQPQEATAEREVGYQVYTDGAWAPEGEGEGGPKYFEAGAGICEFELVKQDDVGSGTEELFDMRQRNTMPDMEAAPKIKGRLMHAHGRPIGIARGGRRARGANAGSDAQVPEYIGAHKQSNNTAVDC